MNILMVSANFPPRLGGPATSVPVLSKYLQEKGNHVEIVTLKYSTMPAIDFVNGVKVHRCFHFVSDPFKVSTPDSMVSVFSMGFKIASLLQSGKFDVIHCHDLNLSASSAIFGKIISGKKIPILSKYTGDISVEYKKNFKKKFIFSEVFDFIQGNLENLSSKLVCPSEFQRTQLLKKGIPPQRISVIYNSVDFDVFNLEKYPPVRQYQSSKSSPFVITYIGRLVSWKGVNVLMEAFNLLRQQLPGENFELHIIGNGTQLENLKQKAKELGIFRQTFFKSVPQHEVPHHIYHSSLVVLPTFYDPFPHSMLEVLAMKRPLIASGVGGIPEVIQHEKNGLLIEPNSVQSLLQALLYAYQHPGKMEELSEAGYQLVKEKFSWSNQVGKFIELYQKIKG